MVLTSYLPLKALLEFGILSSENNAKSKFCLLLLTDANIFNVGETLHPLSKCSTAEVGPTR